MVNGCDTNTTDSEYLLSHEMANIKLTSTNKKHTSVAFNVSLVYVSYSTLWLDIWKFLRITYIVGIELKMCCCHFSSFPSSYAFASFIVLQSRVARVVCLILYRRQRRLQYSERETRWDSLSVTICAKVISSECAFKVNGA